MHSGGSTEMITSSNINPFHSVRYMLGIMETGIQNKINTISIIITKQINSIGMTEVN